MYNTIKDQYINNVINQVKMDYTMNFNENSINIYY